MLIQIRIDDSNYVVLDARIRAPIAGGDEDGATLVTAAVAESKLSNIQADDLLGLVGDCVEFIMGESAAAPAVGSSSAWGDEERRLFRQGKL